MSACYTMPRGWGRLDAQRSLDRPKWFLWCVASVTIGAALVSHGCGS